MTKQNYDAQKGPPHLRIPLTMLDNKEFMLWTGTLECKVWLKMFRHVVRGEMITKLNQKIHDNYYNKGKVCMYKSQRDITDFFAMSNISPVSRAIKSMVEKGIIIPHKDKWNNRSIAVYELGTHDMGPSRHENLHLFIYFTKLAARNELEKVSVVN